MIDKTTRAQLARAEEKYLTECGASLENSWFRAQVSGAELDIRELCAGEGAAVLFVHGGGGTSALWAPLMARLPRVRCIAPDRPGCGMSESISYRGLDLRSHAVEFLDAVLDRHELESAIIVANSMGALWSLWFALDRPHRVRGLAMLGIPALLLGTSAPMPMRLLGKPGIGRLLMAMEPPSRKQVHTLWQRMGHDPSQMSDALHEVMVELQRVPGYALAWRTLLGNVLNLRGARPGLNVSAEDLAAVRVPMLLGLGSSDPFGDDMLLQRAREALKAHRVETLGVGHLPWLDEPEAYAKLVLELVREWSDEKVELQASP
jgi:pimeloyl-ACP methyl ester carboxylesterase